LLSGTDFVMIAARDKSTTRATNDSRSIHSPLSPTPQLPCHLITVTSSNPLGGVSKCDINYDKVFAIARNLQLS